MKVLLHVEGATDALVSDGWGEQAAAVDQLAHPVAGLKEVSRGDGRVSCNAGKLCVLEKSEQCRECLLQQSWVKHGLGSISHECSHSITFFSSSGVDEEVNSRRIIT